MNIFYNVIFSIVLRLMYYLDIGMRAKNGEGLPVCFVYLFILVIVTINGETNPHWTKTEQKRQRKGFREKIGGRALSELKSPIKKKKHDTVFLADSAYWVVRLFLLFKRWALCLVLCHLSHETVAFSRFINQKALSFPQGQINSVKEQKAEKDRRIRWVLV